MTSETLWQPSRQQQLFHLLVRAMAYPGRYLDLALSSNEPAERAVLAALLDPAVSLCDQHELLAPADWLLLAARRDTANQADFVLLDGSRTPDFEPRVGSLAEPELSTTLILRIARLGDGASHFKLSGPGIKDQQPLQLDGLHPDWVARRADWVSSFPLGVELILVDNRRITALPRTTRLELR